MSGFAETKATTLSNPESPMEAFGRVKAALTKSLGCEPTAAEVDAVLDEEVNLENQAFVNSGAW